MALRLVLVRLSWRPADKVLMGCTSLGTVLLPDSTKDSLLHTLVIWLNPSDSGWDCVPASGVRRLAEQGTEELGTSAVTKRVMTQVEGPWDGLLGVGEQQER